MLEVVKDQTVYIHNMEDNSLTPVKVADVQEHVICTENVKGSTWKDEKYDIESGYRFYKGDVYRLYVTKEDFYNECKKEAIRKEFGRVVAVGDNTTMLRVLNLIRTGQI